MWENQTKKETQQQQALKPQKVIYRATGKADAKDSLLAVQCIVCLAVLAFVFLLKMMDSDKFTQVGTQYHAMLEQGVDFGTETPLLRFVNGSVQAAREAAADFVNAVAPPVAAKGMGGFWPVKKQQVPEGASLGKYTLQETLTLPGSGVLTSGFGFRKNPVNKKNDFHAGIDLDAAVGDPVLAALDGQVTEAGYSTLRGNYVVLHHRAGLQTLYQHLSCSFVRTGERVTAGERIAAAGDTGFVTGPHVHFELVVDGLRVDPIVQFPQLLKKQADT